MLKCRLTAETNYLQSIQNQKFFLLWFRLRHKTLFIKQLKQLPIHFSLLLTPTSSSCWPLCGTRVCPGSGRWTWSSRLLTSVVLVSSFPSTPSATSSVPGLPSQCPWGNPSSSSSVTLHPTSSSFVSKSYLDAIFENCFWLLEFSEYSFNILQVRDDG